MTAEPLTTEDARDYAQRWLVDRVARAAKADPDAWRVFEPCECWSDPTKTDHSPCCLLHTHEPLAEPDSERLFAWVRERASTIVGVPSVVADTIGRELGLSQGEAAALLLAAGRPA